MNKYQKSLSASKLLVLGVAYKQDINDYRESPALRVIDYLTREGASVSFYDPYISEYTEKSEVFKGLEQLTPNLLAEFDLVIITTAHSNVDYDMVQRHSKVIFDTRNAMKNIDDRENVVLL
ncbi:UDP-N-acetyl-D-glucosamine 6-dehydrogenase [compost metagenome]